MVLAQGKMLPRTISIVPGLVRIALSTFVLLVFSASQSYPTPAGGGAKPQPVLKRLDLHVITPGCGEEKTGSCFRFAPAPHSFFCGGNEPFSLTLLRRGKLDALTSKECDRILGKGHSRGRAPPGDTEHFG